MSKLRDECKQLRETNQTLQDIITKNQPLREQSLKDDDSKVKYHTGLPSFKALMAVFTLVVSSSKDKGRTLLSYFQQFLMVLMKLLLNLGDQDLAYRFGVNQSTVSRYFKKWIDIMYIWVALLVKWPNHAELLKTLPMEFRKNFRQCAVIIDCFEIFIKRPTNLRARAQTWSNYKHHNNS